MWKKALIIVALQSHRKCIKLVIERNKCGKNCYNLRKIGNESSSLLEVASLAIIVTIVVLQKH